MPAEDTKVAAHRALVDRLLHGEGTTSPEQRASAFAGTGSSPPVQALLGKVVTRPALLSDADFAAAQASGLSDDQIVELIVCAAVGQSARLYEAGLAALAEAAGNAEAGHAT